MLYKEIKSLKKKNKLLASVVWRNQNFLNTNGPIDKQKKMSLLPLLLPKNLHLVLLQKSHSEKGSNSKILSVTKNFLIWHSHKGLSNLKVLFQFEKRWRWREKVNQVFAEPYFAKNHGTVTLFLPEKIVGTLFDTVVN